MLISSDTDDHESNANTTGILGILPVTEISCCDHHLLVLELEIDFSNKMDGFDSCHGVLAFSSIDPIAGSISADHHAVPH